MANFAFAQSVNLLMGFRFRTDDGLFVRDQEVGGSNPLAPTRIINDMQGAPEDGRPS
jgi:hypothetical protein